MSSPEPSSPGGEPNPSPNSESGGTVGNAWRGIQGMNRWALLVIVALILFVVWYFYWHRADEPRNAPRDDPSSDWETRARKLLDDRGYPQNQIDSAMNHYLHGGTMSVEDQMLVGVAIRTLGTPDYPNPQPNSQNAGAGGPSTPTGPVPSGNSDSLPGQADTEPQAFWFVVSTGVGPTSSLRGIAAQYYGSANYASTLLSYNPDVKSVNERIPPGKIVKVPRTINA